MSNSLRLRFMLVFVFAACGGSVVFESQSRDNSGGTGGTALGVGGASTTSLGAGASPEFFIPTTSGGCLLEAPIGPVSECGSQAVDGDGRCVTRLCDSIGNAFVAACLGKHCDCRWNSDSPCECDIDQGDFCGGTTPCCH